MLVVVNIVLLMCGTLCGKLRGGRSVAVLVVNYTDVTIKNIKNMFYIRH